MQMCLLLAFLFGSAVDGLRRYSKRGKRATAIAQVSQKNLRVPGIDDFLDFIPAVEDFPKCYMANSTCAIGSMSKATLVYADHEDARCWNGEPWAFLVHPGNPRKLLMYFTGGGGCWENHNNESIQKCSQTLSTGVRNTAYGLGIFNFNHPLNNKFKDYTLVSLPYCTGGAWVADHRRTDQGSGGYQHGYRNAQIATDWTLANLGGRRLDRFVLAGSSAGAMGVSAWSYFLLGRFNYDKASVLMDSYLGVFPEGTQGQVLQSWKVCGTPLWQSFGGEFKRRCEEGRGNIYDIMDMTIAKYRNVAFAHIQPKGDLIQREFYNAIAESFDKESHGHIISIDRFYSTSNDIVNRYNQHGNYLVYYVTGPWHCFLPFPFWYSTVPAGAIGPGVNLARWAADVVEHKSVSSQCFGALRSNRWPGNLYCDRRLFPKQLFPPSTRRRRNRIR